MIRFSAFLVAVALGLLVAGVVTSKLTLVYVAIGVSGVALLALGVGALLKRNELFGQPKTAEPEPVRAEPAAAAYLPPAQPEPQVAPWEAAVPAASAWPAAAQPAPSRAGYLPSDQPLRPPPVHTQPVQAQPAQAQPVQAQPVQAQPVQAQPINVRPAERPADVPRRPAAFTPRPPAAPPSRVPGVPAPGVPAPGTWKWPTDAPATQPLREMRGPASSVPAESPQAAESQPPAQDQPAAQSQPATPDELRAKDGQPAEDDVAARDQRPREQEPPADSQPSAQDQHETGDERPTADQKTQQLPVFASAAPESAPDAAPAPSEAVPASSSTPAPATVDLQREVTVVPGVPRYHDPQCLLIRFMGENDLDKMTLGAAREAGCTPCRACLPDQPEASPN